MTTLMLSVVVLFVAVSASTGTLLSRYSALESLNKKTSAAVARSCLDFALLNLGQNYNYLGNATVIVGTHSCYLDTIQTVNMNKIIKTKSVVNGATTNYQLIVDQALRSITFEEL